MTETPKGEVTLQTIAMPADANANGDIFGGWLMAQMDLGASVLARRRASGRTATVACDAMRFLKPVKIGDLVSIHSTLAREGRTSMGISVEVWARRLEGNTHVRVAEADFTFVAIDADGRPRELPAT
ncbi:MAG: acyl-CoA thioesterase [Pseudomonadota bacterium]